MISVMKKFSMLFAFAVCLIALNGCTKEQVDPIGDSNRVGNFLQGQTGASTGTDTTGTDTTDQEFECFDFVYPVQIISGGVTHTIQDAGDWETLQVAEEEDCELVYPVDVTIFADGSTVTVNNDDELEAIFDDCGWDDEFYDDDYDDYDDCICFEFVYPLQVTDGQATTTLNSDADWDTLDGDEDDCDFVYPIQVTMDSDGSTVTINNEAELDALFDSCYEEGEDS